MLKNMRSKGVGNPQHCFDNDRIKPFYDTFTSLYSFCQSINSSHAEQFEAFERAECIEPNQKQCIIEAH